MSALSTAPNHSLTAHVRRLSSDGTNLYIRIDNRDVSRLGLSHLQLVEVDLGRVAVTGIVKTSGGSPWLAPPWGSSNAAITAALRAANFEHGMDVLAKLSSLSHSMARDSAVGMPVSPTYSRRSNSAQPAFRFLVDANIAVQEIRNYNGGLYRGRRNVDLDREAYRRFRNGLSVSPGELADQIAFVGEQYGGAQARFLPHSIRSEASAIGSNFRHILARWQQAVAKAKPLLDETPSVEALSFLLSPFVATKQWPVWASKTLHFLRPDSFPIFDSNAKKALGLGNLGSSSREYRKFCESFREALLSNREALGAARIEDGGESPTELKLLDKILFQIGSRMR